MPRKLWLGAAIGLGAAVLAAGLWSVGWLDSWEYTTWSWRVRQAAAPSQASDKIKIILLDQDSLDWGKEENSLCWPWPREVYSPLIDFCRRGGARSLAFDVLFTEYSCHGGVWSDQMLGSAMAQFDGFVGAIFLERLRDGDGAETDTSLFAAGTILDADPATSPRWGSLSRTWRWDGLAEWFAADHPQILYAGAATRPIAEIADSVAALANVSDFPDDDGVFRRASLLRIMGGRPVPSLGLASYLVWADRAGLDSRLRLESGRLSVGEYEIPIDDAARAVLGFVGRTGTHETFATAAVIESELRLLEGKEPGIDPEVFRDCHVFFGFSAPGLLDLRPTPMSRVTPGVEIHATVLDNLLSGGFLRGAPQTLSLAVTALLAVLAGMLVAAGKKAWHSVGAFVLFLPLPVLLGLLTYGNGWWWPVVVGEIARAGSVVGGVVLNYATEGRQKRFIKQAFRYYLNPHVIDRIIDDPGQLQLGGERRELTILFSDLEGFTSISEKLDPQALTELLNDYLSDMTDIILEEGGTLDKYEGDAIIAFWNAPLSLPDHAACACRAARRAQDQLAARREEFWQRTGAELKMRIGIHTGEVVVGNMGSSQRFNYTVLGDAANLASRLEGANKVFSTYSMISESTWTQARDTVLAREMGQLRVVGRQEPVRVFELVGLADETAPAHLAEFAYGLKACYAGELSDAVNRFAALPDDPVAQAYSVRCRQALADGEPFVGVWNLTKK
ncbi:MAG: adenylate/guanylate cyclase domain-containing protein [bacterium]